MLASRWGCHVAIDKRIISAVVLIIILASCGAAYLVSNSHNIKASAVPSSDAREKRFSIAFNTPNNSGELDNHIKLITTEGSLNYSNMDITGYKNCMVELQAHLESYYSSPFDLSASSSLDIPWNQLESSTNKPAQAPSTSGTYFITLVCSVGGHDKSTENVISIPHVVTQ